MSNGYCGNKNTQLDDYSAGYKDGYNEARKKFEAPSGKWLEKGKYQFECNNCHYDDVAIKSNFCPNCGSKMS